MTPRPRSPRGSGDQLADEIIAATTDLLIEKGTAEEVSIRAVATRVGVTPPSIYLHFQDKDELLDAVCAHYYEKFDDVMMAAGAGIDDLWEKAVAQGLAYVRFAIEHEAVFRASFARVTAAGEPSLTDEVLLSAAFSHLHETVEEMMTVGDLAEGDSVSAVLQLWSVAHGLASLMVTKPGLPWGDDFSVAESTLRAVGAGLRVGR